MAPEMGRRAILLPSSTGFQTQQTPLDSSYNSQTVHDSLGLLGPPQQSPTRELGTTGYGRDHPARYHYSHGIRPRPHRSAEFRLPPTEQPHRRATVEQGIDQASMGPIYPTLSSFSACAGRHRRTPTTPATTTTDATLAPPPKHMSTPGDHPKSHGGTDT